ncbi:MAG: cadherin-like beta sandwich domain-containing protein [Bacilli bacterium]|nr:cadherin-like beta sandwich domain-containing protein [Bacilli bacterium]
MKKGLIKKIVLLLLLTIVLPINAKAAVSFSVSKNADNLKSGASVAVTVKSDGVSTADTLYSYNLKLNFDASKLQYVNGGQGISGNNVILSGNSDAGVDRNVSAVVNFKVIGGAGNSNLGLTGSFKVNDDEITCTNSNCKSSQITVAALGTDSSLSGLKIPNTTLKPAFSSEVTNYTATIQDITELDVNATPKDPNAKISISENAKKLQKGENKIDIVVTSEDGQSRKTYTVVVTLNLTPTEAELLKANALLKTLDVKGEKIDFDPAEKKYYLTVPYETKKLTITAKPANEKATVQIDGYKKLIVGKNTVKVTVVSEDKSKIENYQIIVTRQDQEKEIVQTCPEVTSTKEWIIFSVCMLLTFTLGIVLGYYLCKKDIFTKIFTKKEKPQEEAVEVETLSDTIDLSETVNNIKKKTNKSKK